MESFVAFLDILGTKDLVMKDKFSDAHILDFVNPVGLAAKYNQNLRFAVLSDSVIISAESNYADKFIEALASIYPHWFADGIYVRGGIAVGEIEWVDQPHTDKWFRNLDNFMYARVYGKALIEAYEIEQKSGPGAICFINEKAFNILREINSNYVLDGKTCTLIWADEREIDYLCKSLKWMLENLDLYIEMRRHIIATHYYFCQLKNSGKYLPLKRNSAELDKMQQK